MIKHIIFGMDGVLADGKRAIKPACEAVAMQFGLPRPVGEAYEQMIGYVVFEQFLALYPKVPAATLRLFAEEVSYTQMDIIAQTGKRILFPGVFYMLEELMRRGIRLYIASVAKKAYISSILTASQTMYFFDLIACGEATLTEAVSQLVYGDVKRWTFIGTSDEDIKAAKANHISCAAAGYGYYASKGIHHFDRIIHSPKQMIELT